MRTRPSSAVALLKSVLHTRVGFRTVSLYGWTGRWTPGRLAECHFAGSWSSTARTPALADFWAAGLEYEVEDPSALISQLLAAGRIGSEAVVEYRGRRIFRGYAAIRHPEDPFDETSGIGRGRRLLFQEVPERKSGKNRLHIDVHSEPGASTSWLPGWRSWGQPAWARSMRDLRDAGGSCKTPKAMSSALRKPGRRA